MSAGIIAPAPLFPTLPTAQLVALLATPFFSSRGVPITDHEKKHHPSLLSALDDALSVGMHAAITDRIALRDAVCAYLAAEQARGSTVASVVQTVMEILRAADEGAADTHDELAERLVDSCLGFYHATALRSI